MRGGTEETADGPEGEGRYQPRAELGRGGMGVVYRAFDQRLKREVALKVLLTTGDAEAVLRFQREAEAVGRLRHSGIVAVHDAGRNARGHPYLAMDLLPGRSLQEWLDEVGSFDGVDATRIVAALARALEHAHQGGVLHRDLKPANVMLDALDGAPVLTDFGLARLVGRETRLTHTGEVLGTPVFMAPEQAIGDEVDARADVYGLGAILYALLVGKAPFGGTNLLVVLQSVMEVAPPSIRSARPELDPRLEAICLRCLEKDPARRYQRAGDVADALEALSSVGPERSSPRPRLALGIAAAVAFVAVGAWGVAQQAAGPRDLGPAADPSPAPAAVAVAQDVQPVGVHAIELKPGPLEGKDTYVQNDGARAHENHGGEEELVVGVQRKSATDTLADGTQVAYLQFSLDRIPAGATLQGAELRLYLRKSSGKLPIVIEAVAPTVNASGRGASQTPWVEGTSLSNLLLDGVGWWGVAQGERPVWGPDRPQFTQPEGVASTRVKTFIPANVSGYFTIPVDGIVKPWLADRKTNLGLRIYPDPTQAPAVTTAKHFLSSDTSAVGSWPTLALVYEGQRPLPEPDREVAWDVAQAAADQILDMLAAHPGSHEEDLPWLAAAVRVAPFYGRAWFERGRRLSQGRTGGGRSLIQAHTSLLRADRVLRPMRRTLELVRLRSWVAVESGDPPRCDRAIRDLEQFLRETPSAEGRAELERLLEEARTISDRASRGRRVVIQPGPLEGKDAHVRGDGLRANDNYGAEPSLIVGVRRGRLAGEMRALLRFDLARHLPRTARVTQATLRLYDQGVNHFEQRALPLEAHEVLMDWREGSSGYDAHSDGVVFQGWAPNHPDRRLRARRKDLTQPKVAEEVAGRATVPRGHEGWVEFELTGLVRAWQADPKRNRGVRLSVDLGRFPTGSCGRAFVSSDGAAAKRPQLVIRYSGSAPLPQPTLQEQRQEAQRRVQHLVLGLERSAPKLRMVRATEIARQLPFSGDAYLWRAKAARALGWRRPGLAANAHQWLVIAWRAEVPAARPIQLLNLMTEAALRTGEPNRAKLTLSFVESRWPHSALAKSRKLLREALSLEEKR